MRRYLFQLEREPTHMLTFLTIAIVFAVAAAGATVYAILTAKDGYEDETGFHLISSMDSAGEDRASDAATVAHSKPVSRLASARF